MIRLSIAPRKKASHQKEVADKYIAAFREDVSALGVKPATQHPRVISDFMEAIIDFVRTLVDKAMPMSQRAMSTSASKVSQLCQIS